jgi:SAM-dependent methyltransferase
MSNDKLHFIVHDMREVIENKQYDAIFNLFTSFGYFDTFEENAKVLHSAHKMLKNNGFMIIDFMNAIKVVSKLVEAETKTLDEITFEIKRSIVNNRINKDIRFKAEGELYEYLETVAIVTEEDFLAYFTATGFDVVKQYGNYQLDPYSVNESDRLIFILKKKQQHA